VKSHKPRFTDLSLVGVAPEKHFKVIYPSGVTSKAETLALNKAPIIDHVLNLIGINAATESLPLHHVTFLSILGA
jgi:hypothetical protein